MQPLAFGLCIITSLYYTPVVHGNEITSKHIANSWGVRTFVYNLQQHLLRIEEIPAFEFEAIFCFDANHIQLNEHVILCKMELRLKNSC